MLFFKKQFQIFPKDKYPVGFEAGLFLKYAKIIEVINQSIRCNNAVGLFQ